MSPPGQYYFLTTFFQETNESASPRLSSRQPSVAAVELPVTLYVPLLPSKFSVLTMQHLTKLAR